MNPISRDELEGMQETQEAAMFDTCVPMKYSEVLDSIGHPTPTWTDGDLQPCGLDMTGGREQRGSQRNLVTWDARLRLPIGSDLGLKDRVRIVLRFGRPCTPIVYEVDGPAEQGPSGLVVPLKKVEPGV